MARANIQGQRSDASAPMRKAWHDDPRRAAGAAIQKLLRELSDAYWAQLRPFSYRIGVNALVIVSTLLSLSLASLGVWSWVAIGPAVVFATFATGAALGGVARRRVFVAKLWQWMRVWRWYELVTGALIGLLMLGLMVTTPMFWGVLIGTIVGSGTAAIYFLGVVLPARQELQRIERRAHQVVDGIARAGIDPWAIRAGLPRLMGDHWMPLYEALFGYDELANARLQMSADNVGAECNQQSVRDRSLDFILARTFQRQGPVTWLQDRFSNVQKITPAASHATSLSVDDRTLDSNWLAPCEKNDNARQPVNDLADLDGSYLIRDEPKTPKKDLKMNVTIQSDKLSIGSLHAGQVHLQLDSREIMDALPEMVEQAEQAKRQEKRTKIKAMLADARSGAGGTQEPRRLENGAHAAGNSVDAKAVWLGQQTRMLIAGAMLLLAVAWAGCYLAMHRDNVRQLSRLASNLQSSGGSFGSVIGEFAEVFSQPGPAWLPSASLALALLPGGLVLLVSSFFDGWRLSLFAIPAAVLATAGVLLNQPLAGGAMLWHAGLAAAGLLVAGGQWHCSRNSHLE